jgi:hypothetical protein
MGLHPGRKKLVVRSFDRKTTRYSEKVQAKAKAAPPPPAPLPPGCAKMRTSDRPPGPGADRKPGLSIAQQRERRRARLAALAWLKTAWPHLFAYPPKPLAVGLGKEIVRLALAGDQDNHATRAALHYWTRSRAYLEALAAPGAQRLGLMVCRLRP